MGRYKDYREPRGRRRDDDFDALPEWTSELSNPPVSTQKSLPVDAENATPLSDETAGWNRGTEVEATVKWYNSVKGFGFISAGSGDKDIFVHATALTRAGLTTLLEGQKVLVETVQGKKGAEVKSIRLLKT